jgi:hypothetical protein
MKDKVFLILTMLLLSVLCFSTIGQAQDKSGTSAAPELLIPVGARNVGMAGAGISSVSGVDAIFWNPAGLDVSSTSGSAFFSHRSYIADMGITSFAVSNKFSSLGSIGISLRTFNIGEINVTTENQPDGNGEIVNPTYFTFGLTYGRQITDRVGVGVTINLVNESFGSVSASGIAFNAGVQYRDLGGIEGLDVGVSVNNIGTSMRYSGSGLWVQASPTNSERDLTYYKLEAASFQMPSTIDIGLGYRMAIDENTNLQINGAFENNNYGIDEYRIGAQVAFMNSLFLRGGYLYSTDINNVKSIFQNFTVGAGISLQEYAGIPLELNYAYVPVQYFNGNHLIDIRLDF